VRTIFALLQDYSEARTAVHELRHSGFAQSDLNLIVLVSAVDNYSGTTPARVEPDTAERLGGEAAGLDGMLAGRPTTNLPDVGRAYVVGELATMVAKAAMRPGLAEGAFPTALSEIGVPAATARPYADGVRRGGLLLWLNVDDERAGRAAEVLRLRHGEYVANFLEPASSAGLPGRGGKGVAR
jgi:hypothetical protein